MKNAKFSLAIITLAVVLLCMSKCESGKTYSQTQNPETQIENPVDGLIADVEEQQCSEATVDEVTTPEPAQKVVRKAPAPAKVVEEVVEVEETVKVADQKRCFADTITLTYTLWGEDNIGRKAIAKIAVRWTDNTSGRPYMMYDPNSPDLELVNGHQRLFFEDGSFENAVSGKWLWEEGTIVTHKQWGGEREIKTRKHRVAK